MGQFKHPYTVFATAILLLVFVVLPWSFGSREKYAVPNASIVEYANGGPDSPVKRIEHQVVDVGEILGLGEIERRLREEGRALWAYRLVSNRDEQGWTLNTLCCSTRPMDCVVEKNLADGSSVVRGTFSRMHGDSVGVCFSGLCSHESRRTPYFQEFHLAGEYKDVSIFQARVLPDGSIDSVSWGSPEGDIKTADGVELRWRRNGSISLSERGVDKWTVTIACDGPCWIEKAHRVDEDAVVCGVFRGKLYFNGVPIANCDSRQGVFGSDHSCLFIVWTAGGVLAWSKVIPVSFGSEGGFCTTVNSEGSLIVVSSYVGGTRVIGKNPGSRFDFPGSGILGIRFSSAGDIEWAAKLAQGLAFMDYAIPLSNEEVLIKGKASQKGPLISGVSFRNGRGQPKTFPNNTVFCEVLKIEREMSN